MELKGTQSIHVTSMGRSVSRVLSTTPAYCGSHQAVLTTAPRLSEIDTFLLVVFCGPCHLPISIAHL